MFYIHAFTADSAGYTHHHKTQAVLKNKHEAVLSALKMLKLLHDTLSLPLQVMTMENKEVTIEQNVFKGVMVVSAGIPYSFFVPEVELEESPVVYNPGLEGPFKVSSSVPEC